jgi:acyl carrier protein
VAFVEKVKRYLGTGGEPAKKVFPPPQNVDDIKAYLMARLRTRLKMKPEYKLTDETRFDDLGMDSLTLVSMSGELEEWLKVEIDPALLIEFSNIRELSSALDKLRIARRQDRSAQEQQEAR